MDKNQAKQANNKPKRNAKGQLLPGNTANPHGRPTGTVSIMTQIKQYLLDHPEKMDELVTYYLTAPDQRSLLLQMVDGRPQQDLTSGGEKINPNPIYGGTSLQGHDGDPKDIQPQKED